MDFDLTPTTFHRFAQLPPEIRLHVWSLALSGPRTLTVACQRGVNREARAEALRVYGARFRTEHAPTCIYVAFDRDVLRLTEDVLPYVGPEERARVESMIVEVADTGYFGHFYLETLQRMPRLRDLVLILTDMPMDPRRGSGQRYLDTLRAEFREAIESRPQWTCPHVKLLARDGKEEMGVITGQSENDK
ncbi:hypothetical protein P170DRAFT_481393 [Aspergillus steynii IBT 23096]|uniref:2EXR domain-containing protein n=1 Tax=Aspergillus steynii IBT 23096 TaxID=1392250 RepID=A0A2I2FS54_9EURO|nr:uncharacterized protein P170DRAFT_481393 [Aspergillus steynii IBT 23096]PLB43447.1 hypothetical protein P170DRAFT_481393 [Aspergillus steynii IBT 23096]